MHRSWECRAPIAWGLPFITCPPYEVGAGFRAGDSSIGVAGGQFIGVLRTCRFGWCVRSLSGCPCVACASLVLCRSESSCSRSVAPFAVLARAPRMCAAQVRRRRGRGSGHPGFVAQGSRPMFGRAALHLYSVHKEVGPMASRSTPAGAPSLRNPSHVRAFVRRRCFARSRRSCVGRPLCSCGASAPAVRASLALRSFRAVVLTGRTRPHPSYICLRNV